MAVIRRLAAGIAAGLLGASAGWASASGIVFEDRNRDGEHQDTEPGVAGVVVARGAVLVESDERGRYSLPEPADGEGDPVRFIVLTRPAGYDCERWYRADAGDFALVPRVADGSSFVFAHISDAHISDRVADYAKFAVPSRIAGMPRWLAGTAMGFLLRFQNPGYSPSAAARAMRAAVSPYRDVEGWGDASVMGEWIKLLRALGDDAAKLVIDPVGDFDASLAELRALAPSFVVSTGDLVLESNQADAESVGRWMRFYRERTGATGLRFYDTIGNNEIAGSADPDFEPSAPGYGKALFRAHFGPTHYSFDRGGLHFIALDTHAQADPDSDDWSISTLDDEVRSWLEADLAHHAGRSIVVLNHEPIGGDPEWSRSVRAFALVDREVKDQLEAAGVRWTLVGHLHVNGLLETGTTQHIATGSLSGMRWAFPAEVIARGYRLVQLHDGELYSVWKSTGEPVLGFVEPRGDAALHATGPPIPERAGRVVVATADADGPLTGLEIRLDGRLLPVESWSRYFAAAAYDAAALAAGGHQLVVEAQRGDGSRLQIRTQIEGTGAVELAR